MESQNKFLFALFITTIIVITIIIVISQKSSNNKPKNLFDTQPLTTQIIELRTEVDILKGQMQIYENLPIDLKARIELLEGRYDRVASFQNELCQDKLKGD
jgi:hypothetical protein